ncbi:hypothetical protein GCM10009706_14340 [Curtobacterium citreum]|uniref:Tail fiber protein n=1 Tax=Curtobacterium citreum TaxID=2036 RepID=A0ABT2HDL0_9MICO|nr:hypothetical protein [Curtobacterium citreum]MCS6521339.1 hypothetical protein [Curtobacterium citreum]TQJ28198.1 hypothetical protein FB462_2078 [Curtobacterium citreum]GGL77022.1 hypothetical protein GCM10009706_14340 [Curtobacterium citreum]
MAADDYGPKGNGIYSASGASDDGADLTEIAAFAGQVGNRRVGTTAQRNAALTELIGPGSPGVWEGLEWRDTTDGNVYVLSSGAWVYLFGDTGWLNPSFVNGGNPGTGNDTAGQANPAAQYRRRNGVVSMTGYWVPTTNSEIQFRLPGGFRPKNTMTFWCERGSNNGPGAKMEIQRGTGAVIYRVSPSGGTGAVDYGAIRFDADA